MMNTALIISEIISDIILLWTIFILVSIFDNGFRISKSSFFITTLIVSAVGVLIYTTIVSQIYIVRFIMIAVNLSKFCIFTIFIYKCCSAKIVCIILIVQFSCELFAYGIQSILYSDNDELSNILIICLVRVTLFILLIVIKRKTQNTYIKNILYLVPNHIFYLILASCIFASGLVYAADFKTENFTAKNLLIKIFSLVVVLCLLSVLISLITNVIAKKYYSDLNRILEQQVQAQISHYEQREKANTELRKFKHDYNNHINCIQALINTGRYEEVSEYLNKLSTLLPSDSFLYKTGNYLSDAILTDKQENAKKDKIQISFSGTIPTSINNTDLCIILSNALDNAIEASKVCEGEKEISVYGGYRHGYFILVMKNPTVNNISDNAALPATTKEDKLHHGFGLLNINTVVEKYNGFMKTECKDDQFVLSLTFNSVIANTVLKTST